MTTLFFNALSFLPTVPSQPSAWVDHHGFGREQTDNAIVLRISNGLTSPFLLSLLSGPLCTHTQVYSVEVQVQHDCTVPLQPCGSPGAETRAGCISSFFFSLSCGPRGTVLVGEGEKVTRADVGDMGSGPRRTRRRMARMGSSWTYSVGVNSHMLSPFLSCLLLLESCTLFLLCFWILDCITRLSH